MSIIHECSVCSRRLELFQLILNEDEKHYPIFALHYLANNHGTRKPRAKCDNELQACVQSIHSLNLRNILNFLERGREKIEENVHAGNVHVKATDNDLCSMAMPSQMWMFIGVLYVVMVGL